MFLIPKNMSGQKNFRSLLVCMYVCWGDHKFLCVHVRVWDFFFCLEIALVVSI